MLETLKLLVVHRPGFDRETFLQVLGQSSAHYVVEWSMEVENARADLAINVYDAVICEDILNEGTVFEIIEAAVPMPVIVLMPPERAATAATAMRAGAYDYELQDTDGVYLRILPTTLHNTIQRQKTERELMQHLEQTRALQRIDRELSVKLDPDHVLGFGLDAAVRLSRASAAFIALPEGESLRLAQTIGRFVRNTRWQLIDGVIPRVLANRRADFAPRATVQFDPSFCVPETRSYMVIPLVSHNQPLALLYLESDRDGRFVVETFDFMRLVAARIASALDNARLYRESQQQLAELRQLYAALAFQVEHDPLTGLANRLSFEDRLRDAIATAENSRARVAVMYIDLDRFKQVNDTLGHAAGDELLRQVTQRMLSCVRETDTLARIGGDEFTAAITPIDSADDAMLIANRIIETVSRPMRIQGYELIVTASVGISLYPEDSTRFEELMRCADNALYSAKTAGRNTAHLYLPEEQENALARLQLENELRGALEAEALEMAYQPQIRLIDGAVTGMEALIRWNHPTLGRIVPAEFIPLAEETGLILPIGRWALWEACRTAKAWRARGLHTRVSVNIAALQFEQSDFVRVIAEALRATQLDPDALEVEITESVLIRHIELKVERLHQVRALGVHVAIDDFGKGYSSLYYLQHMPISTLKIDRAFVRDIGRDAERAPRAMAILRAIMTVGRGLGVRIVAEGVETQAQYDALAALGCDAIQGYYFHAPLEANAAARLLESGDKA